MEFNVKETMREDEQTSISIYSLLLLIALSYPANVPLTQMSQLIFSYSWGEKEGHMLPFAEELPSKFPL